MGGSASVDLAGIFTTGALRLVACEERTLTANQVLAGATKWTYNVTNGGAVTLPIVPTPPSGDGLTITLTPLQIRTFFCTYA